MFLSFREERKDKEKLFTADSIISSATALIVAVLTWRLAIIDEDV